MPGVRDHAPRCERRTVIKTPHLWSTLQVTVSVTHIVPVDLCMRLGSADKRGIINFIFRRRIWGSEKFRLLAKVAQPDVGRGGSLIQVVCFVHSSLLAVERLDVNCSFFHGAEDSGKASLA